MKNQPLDGALKINFSCDIGDTTCDTSFGVNFQGYT